jgi:hypothetical protein
VAYYVIASTGARTFESKGIRPGRTLAPPGKRVPDGLMHAYAPDTGSLACGLSLPRCSGCLAKVPVS